MEVLRQKILELELQIAKIPSLEEEIKSKADLRRKISEELEEERKARQQISEDLNAERKLRRKAELRVQQLEADREKEYWEKWQKIQNQWNEVE